MTKTKQQEELILAEARSIILNRVRQPGGIVSNIESVKQYLAMEYGTLQNEQFGCMFLDRSFALINHNRMFRGTIDQCATYPREIAREALLQNASMVILIHNHPAHNPVPSADDITMTIRLKQILATVDVHLFDHIIVAGANVFSMKTEGHI